MEIINKNINELVVYENNPRNNDSAVDYVANSIERFGFKVPVIIDKSNVIVAGHTRLKASKKLGITEIPCIIADDLNEEQIKAFRVADNKVGEIAEWDFEKLNLELENLKDFNMEDFGFDGLDDEIDVQELEDVEAEDADIETDIKAGDVYILGRHRLVCGDSTKEEYYNLLMNGIKADLVVTDPPYNVDYSGKNEFLNKFDKGNRIQKDIENDKIENFDLFLESVLNNLKGFVEDYNSVYIFMSGAELHTLRNTFDKVGGYWSDYLVWVKNNHVLGRKDYNSKVEFCMYGWFGMHKFYGGFKTSVLEFNKPLKNDLHPTMKPIDLLAELIRNSSKKDMNVLDVFGGSGSTLIACEQLERNCYMMELDPKYCQVIINRWETLTGEQAKKEECFDPNI